MDTLSERRVKPRISCDYPAIVLGVDLRGNKYEENAKLVNLSASGLYMLVNRYIELGSQLIVTVILCDTVINKKAHKLTTKGIVVRMEPQTDMTWGVAVKFTRYRFQ